jgi:hypothetical protein
MKRFFPWLDLALATSLKWTSIGCFVALLVLLSAVVFVRFVPVASMGMVGRNRGVGLRLDGLLGVGSFVARQ